MISPQIANWLRNNGWKFPTESLENQQNASLKAMHFADFKMMARGGKGMRSTSCEHNPEGNGRALIPKGMAEAKFYIPNILDAYELQPFVILYWFR